MAAQGYRALASEAAAPMLLQAAPRPQHVRSCHRRWGRGAEHGG
jgi:hypothetical protein